MNKSFVAFRQLLVSDEKLPESVEPGVGCFHNPASVLWRTPSSALLSCNPWGVTPSADLLASRFPVISLIRIQESLLSLRKNNDDGIKHCSELADVMSISPGNDQRQRDATAVYQEVALASLFSPGLSGSDRLLPAPGAL